MLIKLVKENGGDSREETPVFYNSNELYCLHFDTKGWRSKSATQVRWRACLASERVADSISTTLIRGARYS